MKRDVSSKHVYIPLDSVTLEGILAIPSNARGMVVFVHGSGSSRFSPRNNFVAGVLQEAGFCTLLFDLLTAKEDMVYERRFDIPFLTRRLLLVTKWLRDQKEVEGLPMGYFGASTGAAVALIAAADMNLEIGAVVSRGGRPDLAEPEVLSRVQAPTLLIVGGHDEVVLELNKKVLQFIKTKKDLLVIPGATHLFEEPGALEKVAQAASNWFTENLKLHPVSEIIAV